MRYKAAFLDRDGTLTYSNPEKIRWRNDIIEQWSEKKFVLPYEKIMCLFEQAKEGQSIWYRDIEDEKAFFERYYRYLLLGEGICSNVNERAKLLFSELWCNNDRLAYPETQAVLEYFYRRGYKLGVISDTSPSLELTLRQLGLAKYFTSFIASSMVGVEKPNPAIYRSALLAQNVSATESRYIDDYDAEADGARSLGFTSFWLDRAEQHTGRWIAADLWKLVHFVEECEDTI